jgi:hypothetical protein
MSRSDERYLYNIRSITIINIEYKNIQIYTNKEKQQKILPMQHFYSSMISKASKQMHR